MNLKSVKRSYKRFCKKYKDELEFLGFALGAISIFSFIFVFYFAVIILR